MRKDTWADVEAAKATKYENERAAAIESGTARVRETIGARFQRPLQGKYHQQHLRRGAYEGVDDCQMSVSLAEDVGTF